MNKSIYSLVLFDEIIDEVDRMASENGTSRSNTVNQILADYFSFTTPEKKLRSIFDEVSNILLSTNRFQTLLEPSDSMFALRSSLSYKYNPSVKYNVVVNEGTIPVSAELRVSIRSQSSSFRLYLIQFFKLWSRIEEAYCGTVDYLIDDDRYVRRINITGDTDYTELGSDIAYYIRSLDSALQYFFNTLEVPERAFAGVEEIYKEYLRTSNRLI